MNTLKVTCQKALSSLAINFLQYCIISFFCSKVVIFVTVAPQRRDYRLYSLMIF